MRCFNCQHENQEGTEFCQSCAVPFIFKCPHCSFKNPRHFNYCGNCGAAPTGTHQAPEAERRQLTVMFCDLVDFVALAERLDPEDLRDILNDYQRVCLQAVAFFGGHINNYLGDGVVVFFGYPVAHEDDAQRAVYSALKILQDMETLNSGHWVNQGIRLDVRIGIHTSLVVAGDMGPVEGEEWIDIVGEAPNIAARLQALAEPNTLLISEDTFDLVGQHFVCNSLGIKEIKGITRPMLLYRPVSDCGPNLQADSAPSRIFTPLVGREEEVKGLLNLWEQAKNGHSQIALIHGEAGIGKSRIIRGLRECLNGERLISLECICSPYYNSSALHPIIALLERWLGFTREDSVQQKRSKLERALGEYERIDAQALPLLAGLLSVTLSDDYPRTTISPEIQRRMTLETLLTLLFETASNQPVLLIFEDVHWIDPSTMELLNMIVERMDDARILLLATFRPDFSPPWHVDSNVTSVALSRLSQTQTGEMVQHLLSTRRLSDELIDQVVSRADGVPLFVEELTKTVLESEQRRNPDESSTVPARWLPSLSIPSTLQDSLMARLDQLAAAKETAQLASALGREFSFEAIHAVSPLEESVLCDSLAQLVESELVYQKGAPPQVTYTFKHALVQEAAYESLLRTTRQKYHREIGTFYEGQFNANLIDIPEIVARHYTRGNLPQQAISFWHKAGQRSIQRAEFVEAVDHLNNGLDLIQDLPVSTERDQQEVNLLTSLGIVLQVTRGYAAEEVDQAYSKARILCAPIGDSSQLFPVLRGQWVFYLLRADYQTAHELAQQLLDLAERDQNVAYRLEGNITLGMTLLFTGDFVNARTHLEQALNTYDRQLHQSHAWLYGSDPGVCGLSYLGRTLWFLGYPDQALRRSHQALELARQSPLPVNTAQTLAMLANVHQVRKEAPESEERIREAIHYAEEKGQPYWVALAKILEGWTLAVTGQGAVGIAQIYRSIESYRSMGATLGFSWFLTLLAEAHASQGEIEQGLSVLDEAQAHVKSTGELYYESEIYRVKGNMFLLQGEKQAFDAAEDCFQQSIAIARRQNARSWELRSAVDLAALWDSQGKSREAHSLLAPIVDWFTEGPETTDLINARRLLGHVTVSYGGADSWG